MIKNNKYRYPKTVREVIEGKRHYNIDDKENEPGKEIRKATWDPHSPTSLGNIRH